ncbi:class I SAM-dependent methyltransferase [Candidatus Woesearchaeota archaeon]|nr:class I SAM-dependent methyltransferase [Candidatus Woesearchaeota archaeon]
MIKKNSLYDVKFLNKFHYNSGKKLNIRLNTWKKYGSNKVDLPNWITNEIFKDGFYQKFLDVGCGNCNFVCEFIKKKLSEDITCVDISKKMLNSCRIKLKETKNKINYVLADVQALPFEDDLFDLVVAMHMLYHVKDIKKALNEIKRVTKNNGLIIITTSNYYFDKGLNKIHYDGLRKFGFPKFTLDKKIYCRFTEKKAMHLMSIFKGHIKIFRYHNDLIFTNLKDALAYYTSSMMYRNTYGPYDERIKIDLWKELLKFINYKINKEIIEKGSFVSPGEVIIFKILNKK